MHLWNLPLCCLQGAQCSNAALAERQAERHAAERQAERVAVAAERLAERQADIAAAERQTERYAADRQAFLQALGQLAAAASVPVLKDTFVRSPQASPDTSTPPPGAASTLSHASRGSGSRSAGPRGQSLLAQLADAALRASANLLSRARLGEGLEGQLLAALLHQRQPLVQGSTLGGATSAPSPGIDSSFPVDCDRYAEVILHRLMMPLSQPELPLSFALPLADGDTAAIPTVVSTGLDDNRAISVSLHAAGVGAEAHWASLTRLDRGASRNGVPICQTFTVREAAQAGFTVTLDEQGNFPAVSGPSRDGTPMMLLSHASLRITAGGQLDGKAANVLAEAFHSLTQSKRAPCTCTRVLPLALPPPPAPLSGGRGGGTHAALSDAVYAGGGSEKDSGWATCDVCTPLALRPFRRNQGMSSSGNTSIMGSSALRNSDSKDACVTRIVAAAPPVYDDSCVSVSRAGQPVWSSSASSAFSPRCTSGGGTVGLALDQVSS